MTFEGDGGRGSGAAAEQHSAVRPDPVVPHTPGSRATPGLALLAVERRPSAGPARPRRPIDRNGDRRVTFAGIAISAAFVALAVVAALLPPIVRRGAWLPLHLLLAGAAGVAIGAVLPFFVAALSAAPPAPTRSRAAVVAMLALGALGVTAGVAGGQTALGVAGGLSFVAGLVGLAIVVGLVVRGALGRPSRLHPVVYLVAIGEVAIGATLGTLYVAGWTPLLERWASIKPAHAWLNLLGFVAVTIAATLVHLFPTVVGTRIAESRLVRPALAAAAVGPALAATGYLLRAVATPSGPLASATALDASGPVVVSGAVIALAGDLALAPYLLGTWRRRGRWTTDAAWHRFTTFSLGGGFGWHALALVIATAEVLRAGSDPAGWSLAAVAAPLGLGFVAQVLVGSWTHLMPAIGPGDQRRHATQRRLLAYGADARIVALNLGAAIMAVGLPLSDPRLTSAGGVLAGGSLLATVVLVARAVLGADDVRAQPSGQAREARG